MNSKTTSFSKISAIRNTLNINGGGILRNQNTHSNGQLNQRVASKSSSANNAGSSTNGKNLKTWRSDTNLYATNQASVLPENEEEEEGDDDDEVDDILFNHRQLEFSDHAGLYDILDENRSQQHDDDDSGQHQMDLEEEVEASLKSNQKIYNLSKKHYKLTYDPKKPNSSSTTHGTANKKRDFFGLSTNASSNLKPTGQINEDSLILNTSYNGLLVEQSDYDPNYDKGNTFFGSILEIIPETSWAIRFL